VLQQCCVLEALKRRIYVVRVKLCGFDIVSLDTCSFNSLVHFACWNPVDSCHCMHQTTSEDGQHRLTSVVFVVLWSPYLEN
jgi:hypothetical protein